MPEPTKLPSAPSCIISAASAGVAIPPAQNSGTGSRPAEATSWTTSSGAWCSLAAPPSSPRGSRVFFGGSRQLLRAQLGQPLDAGDDLAHMSHRLDHVAGPGLALGADHRRAL